MADVNANIGVNIDTSNALAQLKSLQRQLSQFHTSIARTSEAAALAQRDLQKNLLSSINATGAFAAELRTIKTTSESFTSSLEKNKFSMRQYFKFAAASTKTFGKSFTNEFDTIEKVATERVKRLQTQYIKLGRDANGAMKAIAVMPTSLDMGDYGTKLAIAAQKQQLFNQLMKQGSTNLINFGKNTQWAGRQLMVGFTVPLTILGTTATKVFMDMEAQAIKFKKVYGDLFTPQAETQQALEDIQALGLMFTRYGIAVSDTVGLAADAAAAGFKGVDLQRQTTQATRLSVLGQIDNQQALETTISLQNAFSTSSDKLAGSIDFLNAVENQTVLSLEDVTIAIPKVAPVIQQLGGDVKDLAFFMTAMKEGGINASEGANALKSGLASMINPTTKAVAMLEGYGINIKKIVEGNQGDIKSTVIDFAKALDTLAPLDRAKAIEQMFGKFQFARLSTLFQNVTKDGTQASRVLALAGTSIEDLASMSERELGMTADSPMVKFKASVEQLKASLIPVGETFLQAVTPIIDFVGNILSKFNNLSSGTKKFITLLTIGLGAVGPVLLMTFGLLANGVGNIIKLFLTLRNGYLRLTGQTELLGQETNYMTMEQLDAAAAAHSLDQAHAKLTQQFTSEAAAVEALTRAYASATGAAQRFAAANPGMILPGRMPKKFAEGGIISGPGGPTSDSVPIMASNGEAIIAAKTVKKYPGMVNGLIAGNIPGFATSGVIGAAVDTSRKQVKLPGSYEMSHFGGGHQMSGQELIAYTQQASQSVRDQIQRLVSDVTNGLEYMFTVYDNKVVAMSDQLNQAVGESGSGKRAPISLAKRDLIDRGDARDIELSRLLDKAGVPIEEIKLITQNVTTQIEEGFTKLGDISTVTAEDLDRLLQDAYEAVSESDARVKAAYSQMGEVRSVADPLARGGKQNRIAIKEQSYKTQRPKYNQVMNTMTDNNPPYQLKGAMVLTDQMSQELQMTKEEIARIFKQLSAQVQVELAGLKDDAVAFATVFKDAALKIEAQATETGRSAITGLAKGTRSSSPSEEAIRQGDNVTEGFELGLRNGIPEVAAAATQVGQTAISKLINPSTGMPFATDAFSPGGIAAGAGVPLQQIVDNSRKSREDLAKSETIKKQVKLNESMDKLNKRVMGGMFAMTALSGIAQTAGGNLGKLSEIAFQISGPLFAFSSILQMLTGTKIVEFITKFKVGFGIASLALAAGVITIKAVNAARRREYMAINGLADAMKTTTDQVKTLGDFFGVVPTKLPFDVGQRELVAPTTRTQREKLKDNPEFQAQFKDTIESLRKATNDEAKLVFSGLALNLKAQGFANEQVQTIIDALREESSQTDVVLDVKSLTLSKKSLDEIKKDLIPALVKLNSALKTGATEMSAMQWGTDNVVTWTELTKEAKKELATVSTFMSEAAKSASGMFELGLIDGKQYEGMLMTLLQTTDGLDKAQRKLLLSKVFEQLGVSADKYTKSLYTARQEMQLLALLSSGVLSKDSPILKALASTDYKTNMRGVAGLKKLYDQMFGSLTKIKDKQDEIDKNNNDTSDGDGYDFFKDIKQKTLELKNQSVVLVKLRAAGIAYADAMEIASNPDMAAAIIELSKTEDGWKKAKAAIKAYNDEKKKAEKLQIATQDQGDYELTRLKMAQAYVALQEHLIDMQHIPTFKKYNDELLKQQIALEGINAEIKEITDTEIVPLQDQMRLNDYELQQIALAEDEINSKYDEQAKALEKIKTINEDIAAAQKNRLSLADALSRGDISAAAGIVQDERARQASQGMNTMSSALTNSRDQQINALGRNDLEKQNKLIQMEIARIQKEKLWDLEKEATKIQNIIDGINAEKTALERVIEKQKESIMYFGMTKAQIDAAVSALDLAKSAGIDINDPNFLNNILKGAKGDADALKLAIDAVAAAARIAFAELDALRKSSQLGASSLVPGKNDGVPDPLDTPIVPGASADAVKEAEDAAKAAADAAAAAAESNAATQELIDALAAIDAANKAADEISASTRKIAATAIVKATNTQSLNKAVALAEGNLSPESIAINMGRALTKSESMTKSLGGIGGALSTARYTGQAMRYAEMGNYAPGLYSGGIVPKSFSVGGFAMGSDIVPARLTPGEFVMSKYAVETHGVDKMKAINNGDSVGDSVYNYNLSVNVKSDANPDEIAKSVMAHIKQVDSQRIRSSRF